MMKKQHLHIIKKMNTIVKKSSIPILQYGRVVNGVLATTNLDSVTVTIHSIGIPDGMYLLADLAKGKVLKITKA